MKDWYFTFGSNHKDRFGRSLGHSYTVISGKDWLDARRKLFELRGDKWAFQYESAEKAGVERFGLKQVSLGDIAIDHE